MYEEATVSGFVIMPNHVHLIIETSENNKIGISRYIGLLKRMSNKESGNNLWQKSFYDHIIRDDDDYYYHLQYIEENPGKWLMGKDKYYV